MRLTELHQIFRSHRVLLEGGNVFETPDEQPLTQRIAKAQIEPTLKWLESITGLSLVDQTLGSVGKKESSGDLDLAVDENTTSKDELVAKLAAWCKQQNIPEDQIANRAKKAGNPAFKAGWIAKSGISVHFRTPIAGNPKNGFVQTDFMFTKDPGWMKFGMYAPGDVSKYSGAERNLLMSSIAKAQGLKYSWQNGLMNRETGVSISKDPDTIAKKLFGTKFDHAIFNSVENMQRAVAGMPKLKKQFQQLVQDLAVPTGKPSEDQANQEEVARITKLLGPVL